MAAISPEQVAEVVASGFKLLNEASDLTSGRDPNYIRDAQPANVIDALALAAARQGCRRYQQKGGDYSSRRAARAERACRPYLDSLESGTGPELELPFRGGQCNDVYLVSFTARDSNSGPVNGTVRARGPILGIRTIISPTGARLVQLNCRNVNLGASTCGLLSDQGQAWRDLVGLGTSGDNPTASITGITPCGANNCGNVPPEFTGPKPPVTPLPPGPQPVVRSPDLDVDVNVTINPDFSINVDIGTGPITIDPFADPSGGGGGPAEPGAGDQTDPGSPGVGGGTGAGGDAEGMAPEGQEIVGLLVTVTEAPGDANRFANNARQPFRGIGYIRMGYPGRLGIDISGGTVISPQFFHAPQRGLTNWAVAANIGFNLTVIPYYRPIEP